MGDEELEAIRARRMAQLQQEQVCFILLLWHDSVLKEYAKMAKILFY